MDGVYALNAVIGEGLVLGDRTTIGTPEKPVDNLVIGDHVTIGSDCTVWSSNLSIGDYTKIHNHTLIYGRNNISLGNNCWIGQHSILDGEGGLIMGDNVGVGANSQLWSHIRHGDVVLGCKYLEFGQLTIENDVWFVGHCVVSPIIAKAFSMALVGSVVTKSMEANHIYGGTPAKDLTDKLGPPFVFKDPMDRWEQMNGRLAQFEHQYPEHANKIAIVLNYDFNLDRVQFNVVDRTYTKTGLPFEVAFMKFLLPEAKFTPRI